MGVTLGRRVIKGGNVRTQQGSFNLGSSLASRVDTFVGICGANWGLAACAADFIDDTCNNVDGFYPGWAIGPLGLSTYLDDLNSDKTKEGSHVFAMLSTWDDLILFGDLVYGRYTSEIPT